MPINHCFTPCHSPVSECLSIHHCLFRFFFFFFYNDFSLQQWWVIVQPCNFYISLIITDMSKQTHWCLNVLVCHFVNEVQAKVSVKNKKWWFQCISEILQLWLYHTLKEEVFIIYNCINAINMMMMPCYFLCRWKGNKCTYITSQGILKPALMKTICTPNRK